MERRRVVGYVVFLARQHHREHLVPRQEGVTGVGDLVLIEAIGAIYAGTVASSAALIGFGLDSVVEVMSAAAVAWRR